MIRRKIFCFSLLILSSFLLNGCSITLIVGDSPLYSNTNNPPLPSAIPHLINPGEVFTSGSYIEVAGVTVLYNGDSFEITNNRSDHVRITAAIVGIKKDGSYELLQIPTFYGVDTYQYSKDLEENGWAVENHTNLIRPGYTLTAKMLITDFSQSGFTAPDIDGDGYYDIIFTISPQATENSIQSSTADPESGPYRLPAK